MTYDESKSSSPPMGSNTLEVEPDYFNPPNEAQEDIHYNPSETTIYESNDLDYVSKCLDNLCIMSQFCSLTSLDEYVLFMRDHSD
tara:strand:- start:996 stop:1250 length:255 start_codon:yes stop_codon:yes gene_type:complete